MLRFRHQRGLSQSPWIVTVAMLLLLVVLFAAVSHSPVAVCCFVLVAVFLFALVELSSYGNEEESDLIFSLEDCSPLLFQRPPPSLL